MFIANFAQDTTGLLCLKLNRMEHTGVHPTPLKEINHLRSESVVKTTYAQFHTCFLLVFPLQSPDSAQKTHTESKR